MRHVLAAVAVLGLGCASDYVPTSPNDPTSWSDGEAPSQVGAPCELTVPPEGFDPREVYAEPHAATCGGLVCMAYRVDTEPGEPVHPVDRGQLFCTCRCSSLEGDPTVPLCRCENGMRCEDELFSFPGTGLGGGYCVPCITPDDDRDLNPLVFEPCET